MEGSGSFRPNQEQAVAFMVPPDAPSTNLRANPPRYWELEVEVDAPGVNFLRTYGVPIYHRTPERWAQSAAASERRPNGGA